MGLTFRPVLFAAIPALYFQVELVWGHSNRFEVVK
jgi:hypothetical protein